MKLARSIKTQTTRAHSIQKTRNTGNMKPVISVPSRRCSENCGGVCVPKLNSENFCNKHVAP